MEQFNWKLLLNYNHINEVEEWQISAGLERVNLLLSLRKDQNLQNMVSRLVLRPRKVLKTMTQVYSVLCISSQKDFFDG